MCKSLTNYFPRNNDFLVTYFGKTQKALLDKRIYCYNNCYGFSCFFVLICKVYSKDFL